MNILLINYELPPLGGGGGRATLRLAREFAAAGHQVLILTSAFKRLPKREELDGVRIRRIPTLRKRSDRCGPVELVAFALSACLAAPKVARRFGPHVIGAFFSFPSGVPALFLRLCRRLPYVVSLRGSDVPRPESGRNRLLQALLVPLSRLIWRHAARVVSVSAGLRESALRIRPDCDIEVIPNAVDAERFSPAEEPIRGGQFRMLFVGRLQHFKGLQFLLPAIADARKELGTEILLDVVGEGSYRRQVEEIVASLGLRDAVRFHGWIGSDRIPEFYRRSDALALPSFGEGMPNVVLEAMACGLPIVATDVSGNNELVTNGVEGILVPVQDSHSLARAIVRLASDPEERKRMAVNSRRRALEFDWKKSAQAYLHLYMKAAKTCRSGI